MTASTQIKYPKRLIEVDLPIRRISEHARREKSIRHGHISTLHIWWARRPLAACRAVLCASLWPDPGDELCPEVFKTEAKRQMLAWATKHQNLMSGESLKHFNQIVQNPDLLNQTGVLRRALLDFIADFANWDNSTKQEYLATCRTLTQVAHESLGGIHGTRPLVADPFAGGGSIPLEALRVGADAFASDLNPVAVLLNKVILEYIPKYGNSQLEMLDANGQKIVFNGLSEAVRYWGQWIKQEAEKELAQFYPKDADGSTPIAYLWARTVLSEAPDDGHEIPVEVPLIRSLWLAKKSQKSVALRWIRNEQGQVETELVEVEYSNGEKLKVRRPKLEVFYPQKASEVESGTVARGSATCPVTGYTTPVSSVRRQLKARRGGGNDARMLAVVTTQSGQQGRFYRLPNQRDLQAVIANEKALKHCIAEHTGELSLVPDEPLENIKGRFNIFIYGIQNWGDLLTNRQAFALITLNGILQKISEKNINIAVLTCLAFLVDKQADSLSSIVSWAPNGEFQRNTFGRQSLPMVWDFAEINPCSDASGNFGSGLNWVCLFIEQESKIFIQQVSGQVERASATKHLLATDSIQAFFTDPPYYDAIPYSDLSDFFYNWLKRILSKKFTKYFSLNQTPKNEEIVYISHLCEKYEMRTSKWFENQMQIAMEEGRRILSPSGVGVVVFAHKTTNGWEAQLQAMLNAGWIVTSSWPIDTERASRNIAIGAAALASSVHLVCRPRENPDGTLITDQIGDWRDILAELPIRIHEWMPRLAQEGVVGADAIFACLGPALEVFSRYSSVEKASGEAVSLGEYLEHVWAAVAKEALNMIFAGADTSGFEEDARLTAMWLWTLSTADGQSHAEPPPPSNKMKPSVHIGANYFPGANAFVSGSKPEELDAEDLDSDVKVASVKGFALEYDAARKIAQGLGAHLEQLAHLVEVKGSEARLLPVSERGAYLFGKQTTVVEQVKGKKTKAKSKQANIFELFDASGAESGDAPAKGFSAEVIAPDLQIPAGKSILDRIHQCMILFATGQSDALRRFLVEEGIGRDERFWRLAQALSALYPQGTDEKRWVDGVLARKKGLGF